MSPLDVADNKGADTERASPAYVPPLQRTEGHTPPLAAHGGLSYMSFDRDGDAGTAEALQDERHVGQAAMRRDGRRLPFRALERRHVGRRGFLRVCRNLVAGEIELAHGTPP